MTRPASSRCDMRVIGRLELPAFDPSDFEGFTVAQIRAGVVRPAAVFPQHSPEYAAKICPVFRFLVTGRSDGQA